MRIIAGKYKSRRLSAPAGMETRPTSDRLRETLFGVLTHARSLEGSVWFDLFAGAGAVGIEALSRGAGMVYFVESSRPALQAIRENLASLAIHEDFEIVSREAAAALRHLNSRSVACNFCFLDPPYRKAGLYGQVLRFLAESRLLAPTSLVVAEHDRHFDPGDAFGSLLRCRTLRQGDAVLSFYRRAPLHNQEAAPNRETDTAGF